ncbi:hypothetical protein ANABIO32_00730 [Rossellomorea marisflavi]|uniref:hypothetical protein n=1 Tax=Rossellomorea marisflavi TaxID=189381 RepID=UPI0025CAF813|nr:hypothetical protein [Rossellomorea marisflavi]GLI82387.1 hypothetical protein ANABIO32_00730 [Rossellomorea marisflavi]
MKNIAEINYQEYEDYKILFEMFGDDEYKIKIQEIEESILTSFVNSILNEDCKYLKVTNALDPKLKNVRYTTVVIVEPSPQDTLAKIKELFDSLGEIEWVKFENEFVEVKIKDSYLLTVYDFTGGVF